MKVRYSMNKIPNSGIDLDMTDLVGDFENPLWKLNDKIDFIGYHLQS